MSRIFIKVSCFTMFHKGTAGNRVDTGWNLYIIFFEVEVLYTRTVVTLNRLNCHGLTEVQEAIQ